MLQCPVRKLLVAVQRGESRRRRQHRRIEFGARLADFVVALDRNPYELGVEVILEVFRPQRPLRYAQDFELGQDELTQVLGGNDVGKEQADHFAPHDMLPAQAEIPITGAGVDVVFTQ